MKHFPRRLARFTLCDPGSPYRPNPDARVLTWSSWPVIIPAREVRVERRPRLAPTPELGLAFSCSLLADGTGVELVD